MKSLEELVRGLGTRIDGAGDTPIAEICTDSRQVTPGALFVALRGATTDGHRYAARMYISVLKFFELINSIRNENKKLWSHFGS